MAGKTTLGCPLLRSEEPKLRAIQPLQVLRDPWALALASNLQRLFPLQRSTGRQTSRRSAPALTTRRTRSRLEALALYSHLCCLLVLQLHQRPLRLPISPAPHSRPLLVRIQGGDRVPNAHRRAAHTATSTRTQKGQGTHRALPLALMQCSKSLAPEVLQDKKQCPLVPSSLDLAYKGR